MQKEKVKHPGVREQKAFIHKIIFFTLTCRIFAQAVTEVYLSKSISSWTSLFASKTFIQVCGRE